MSGVEHTSGSNRTGEHPSGAIDADSIGDRNENGLGRPWPAGGGQLPEVSLSELEAVDTGMLRGDRIDDMRFGRWVPPTS